MNYLKLIKEFWVQHNAHSLGVADTTLYFYLLEINNICRWSNTYRRSNTKIQSDLNISAETLRKSRNRLKNIGLIDFRTQKGSSFVTYVFPDGEKENQGQIIEEDGGVSGKVSCEVRDEVRGEVRGEVRDEVRGEVRDEVSGEVRDELNKTKTKTKTKTNYTPVVPKGENINSIDYKKMQELFNSIFEGKLSSVSSMTPGRKRAVRNIIRQFGYNSIEVVFGKIIQSPFLLGGNEKRWRCDFDWIFQPGNYVRILEGIYENVFTHADHPFTERLNRKKYERF